MTDAVDVIESQEMLLLVRCQGSLCPHDAYSSRGPVKVLGKERFLLSIYCRYKNDF